MRVVTRKLIPLDSNTRSGTELDKSAARASVTLCVCGGAGGQGVGGGGGGIEVAVVGSPSPTVSVDAVIPAAATDLLGRSLAL